MAANDRLVGDVLDGRYEIIARIGRGGMATVYRAKDRRLDRIVAVKIMRDDVDEDPDNAARFDSEAREVARLSDAHIVSVFDQGTDRDRPYIVMECVDGTNLKAIIVKQGALPLSRALTLLEAITGGLAVAHDAGIIHRDIKPENVLISRSGEAKVTDFGLARKADVTAMTVADGVLGSLSYVSPERLLHQAPVTFSSDVYSVGIVAFEMLTGRKPFDGDQGAVVTQHLQQDVPSPAGVIPSIPAWLDALVMACGRRNADERPADARDLLNRLRMGMEAMRNGTANDPALIAAMSARPGSQVTAPPPAGISKPAQTTSIMPPVKDEVPSSPIAARVPTRPAGPNFRARRIFVALLTAAVLIAAVLGGWWLTSGRYTTMPDVIGHTQSDAIGILANAGLTLVADKDYSETVPAGSVIDSTPKAGDKVRRGSTVHVVVSQGAERFAVPKLVGLPLDEAKIALSQANLATGDVSQQYSETVDQGVVISASQKEGAEVKRGTTIDMVVSQGPAPINVPDYTGKSAAEAMDALEKLGLSPVQTIQYSDTVAAGVVISQTPNSGTAHKGDTVTLVVSQGPQMVTIPAGLVGATDVDAKKILEDLGLKVVFVPLTSEVISKHIVDQTNPPSGTTVQRGATVTLYIG